MEVANDRKTMSWLTIITTDDRRWESEAKDKLESVRWPKSDGEVKSPTPSIPDLTVSDSIEYRAVKSPSGLSLDTDDDSDLDDAPASTMDMTSDDPSNLHMVASEITSGDAFPARELISPNPEVDDTPLGYRSLAKTPALERSVEEARKQYMILKQKAKNKLDSIRMPKPCDDNKAMSPIHAPLEHITLVPSTGTYRAQSGEVLEPTKGLEGLDMDDSDLDSERMSTVDTKIKLRNAKSRTPTSKGVVGHFDQGQQTKGHQHGKSIPITRGETVNKDKGRYTHALPGTEPEMGRLETEKNMQEIVKLGEETQYYRGRQRLFDDEKEIFKLKKEKLRIEIEILEKRLLGHIKQTNY